MPDVNLATAQIAWDWSIGTGGDVDSFTISVGSSAQNYNKPSQSAGASARDYLVRNLVSGTGSHYVAVKAVNTGGGSVDSNEINFNVHPTPFIPTVVF